MRLRDGAQTSRSAWARCTGFETILRPLCGHHVNGIYIHKYFKRAQTLRLGGGVVQPRPKATLGAVGGALQAESDLASRSEREACGQPRAPRGAFARKRGAGRVGATWFDRGIREQQAGRAVASGRGQSAALVGLWA